MTETEAKLLAVEEAVKEAEAAVEKALKSLDGIPGFNNSWPYLWEGSLHLYDANTCLHMALGDARKETKEDA